MSDGFDPYRKWLGIPPEEQPPNFYRLLGIPLFETDPDVIENAAHRQMAYVRTFQTGRHAEQSQRLLNELAAAKVCLMNPDRKAAYDAELHRAAADGGPQWRGDSAIGSLGVAGLRGSNPGGTAPMAQFVGGPPGAGGLTGTNPAGAVSAGAGAVQFSGSSTTAGLGGAAGIGGPAIGGAGVGGASGGQANGAAAFVPPVSTGAARRPGGSRARRGERRNVLFLSALFGGLGVVAVIVIVVLLAVNYRLQKGKKGSGDIAGGAQGGLAASGSGGAGGSGKTSGSGSTTAGSSGGSSSSGTPGNTAQPSSSGSSDKSQTLSNREDRVRASLKRVREMLAERDFNRAKTTLNSAGVPVRNAELRAEYDRVEVFITYYSEFWRAVRSGASKVVRPKATEEPSKPTTTAKPGESKGGDSKIGPEDAPKRTVGSDSDERAKKSDEDQAKSGGSKSADAKEDDPKEDDPKADAAKKGDAKKDDAKTDDSKTDDAKKEDAKKDDAKVESGKKEDANKGSSDSASRRRDFAFRGSTYEVLEAERDHFKVLVDGEEQTWTMNTIPPKAAVAIAFQGVRADDPFINIYAATFLMFDLRGDLDENRRVAVELWNETRRRTGVPNKFLQDEFNLKTDDGN
ncbi:MAG TPA: hypothetical protein PLV92_12710, partial [Pirellulaceae bacterium]|nr:hypothetical protein [Pirellulaceae bacterium]